MQFGILKKFLLAFVTLSVLPLVVLSYYAQSTIFDAGQSVLDSSRQALIKNASELLTARARAIAHRVEGLLESCVDNMRAIAAIQPHPAIYYQFLLQHQREIWVRSGTPDYPSERRIRIPLYREITYLDPNGVMRIRVDAQGISYDTQDLSSPFHTEYGEENYFQAAQQLPEGKVYVSHLLGRHVRPEDQLQGADHVEHAIGGAHYRGIIRFAAPVYSSRQFIGVVSMALDHQHLMEMTQHVLPIGSQEVIFPSYQSGNYAFLFDDEGWIITHPKFWDIRGYDQDTGKLQDPTQPYYNEKNLKAGLVPFNLMYVPFIHVNYRHITMETLAGRSGITQTHSVGGVPRVLAFAPIAFNFGEYAKTGYFGGVTLGANTSYFHQAVDETSQEIKTTFDRTVQHFIIIILLVGAAVVIAAGILARGFTLPILHLTQKVKNISRGHFDVKVTIRSKDELAVLGNSIQDMGQRLKENQASLVQSFNQLEASKTEVELSNRRLEAQVNMLKIIHRVGHQLSVNFDQDQVLELISRTCVEGIGFHRAAVFLMNTEGHTVERVHVQSRFLDTDDDTPLPMTCPLDPHAIDLSVTAFADPGLQTPINGVDSSPADHWQAFVPLRMADRVIGVLGADHPPAQGPISDGELESLKIIANEAAMALERVRLMKAALGEKEFIQRIFSNMMSAVLVIGPDGRISAANPRAAALVRVDPDAIIGQPAASVLAAYPSLYDHIMQAAAEALSGSTDLEIGTARDSRLFVEVAVSSFQEDAKSTDPSILVIFRDITRRKQMEQVITRSDRLVSVGTLAAGIAHEIRNPLTGICLMLDSLHDRMADRTDERLMMQQALEEIEKLERIVTDLLEFAAKPTSHLAVQDLNSIIDQTRLFVQKQCHKQGVSLEMQASNDPLPSLLLDGEKIKQAVLNIIINALKAMPEGGTIHISTHYHDHLNLFNQQAGVELRISDTGHGIDPGDMNYIFDPFFTRSSDGYGLGLSITHTIVEEHGGKITVESEPGKGASFRVFFPEHLPDKE